MKKDLTLRRMPRLEHRHYALLAGIIRELNPEVREEVAEHFARALCGTNDRFSPSRFIDACFGR